jgi:hypothetical protein
LRPEIRSGAGISIFDLPAMPVLGFIAVTKSIYYAQVIILSMIMLHGRRVFGFIPIHSWRCIMKVVILAGGFGTRLSEETGVRPKPMVEIGGKPKLLFMMANSQTGKFILLTPDCIHKPADGSSASKIGWAKMRPSCSLMVMAWLT